MKRAEHHNQLGNEVSDSDQSLTLSSLNKEGRSLGRRGRASPSTERRGGVRAAHSAPYGNPRLGAEPEGGGACRKREAGEGPGNLLRLMRGPFPANALGAGGGGSSKEKGS